MALGPTSRRITAEAVATVLVSLLITALVHDESVPLTPRVRMIAATALLPNAHQVARELRRATRRPDIADQTASSVQVIGCATWEPASTGGAAESRVVVNRQVTAVAEAEPNAGADVQDLPASEPGATAD